MNHRYPCCNLAINGNLAVSTVNPTVHQVTKELRDFSKPAFRKEVPKCDVNIDL